jgi:magnesium chelatase subunit D
MGPVAVGATVRRAASRGGSSDRPTDGPLAEPEDLREAVREQKSANLIVLAVDASSSMGAEERLAAARGAVLSLLRDAYQRRDLVALIGFRQDRADVLLRPTGSIEVARARLAELPTGGRTPLAAGIAEALRLATAPAGSHRPWVVVITDGRATSAPAGGDPFEEAAAAADEVRRQGVAAVIIDVEGAGAAPGSPRLGLAGELAARMGARHVKVDRLNAGALEDAVLGSLPARGK